MSEKVVYVAVNNNNEVTEFHDRNMMENHRRLMASHGEKGWQYGTSDKLDILKSKTDKGAEVKAAELSRENEELKRKLAALEAGSTVETATVKSTKQKATA